MKEVPILSSRKLSREDYKKAVKKLKLAYTLISTMPGIPCIFYGDEVGVQGYRDPFNRKTFPWGRENKELLDFYKQIGEIRTSENVYKKGRIKLLCCNEDIIAFARYEKREILITVINRSDKKFKIALSHTMKDMIRNRFIRVVKPCESYVLKGRGFIDMLKLDFTEIDKNPQGRG